MISEQQRRAYLGAMQVVSWLPTQVLPFAAPSRPALLPDEAAGPQAAPVPVAAVQPAPLATIATRQAERMQSLRARLEQSRPAAETPAVVAAPAVEIPPASASSLSPVPRFSLQLYRAGACLLLVELPTGEAFQSRDPAYLLLKDLLRAAGLPDSPQLLGDPVHWPLLAGGNLDQGPAAARDFLQHYLAVRLEAEPGCACLWLVGLPAMRHTAGAEADMYNCELQIAGLGMAWALPSLELLMDEPQRKAPLWHAMRRLMRHWQSTHE